jgi:NAD(P)-dependent dehydrogenase (short-subunit alcohol dehydrogenase family)
MEGKGRLEKSVAVITGGASGLGKAAAELFAEHGASIVIADINEERLKKVTSTMVEAGNNVIGVSTDVTKRHEVESLIAKTIEHFGAIDILINCAGIGRWKNQWGGKNWLPMEELCDEDWDAIIEINLKGTFLTNQVAGKRMIAQNHGVIVNVASLSGVLANKGLMGHGAYAASKAGVIGLTRVLATEWARYNIRVNAVSPGYMDTGLLERTKTIEGLYDLQIEMTPMKRYGRPEEFAHTVLYLASDDASFVTGHNLIVDGGFTAW